MSNAIKDILASIETLKPKLSKLSGHVATEQDVTQLLVDLETIHIKVNKLDGPAGDGLYKPIVPSE